MPRLGSQAAAAAKKAAVSGGFEALEPGIYLARLTSVVAKEASTGNPMWVWEYEVLDEPYEGRKLWNNTVLIDNSMWAVGQTFAAFGFDTDTDTDELVGETVRLDVVQRTIGSGSRAGQTGNNVNAVLPAKEGVEVGTTVGTSTNGAEAATGGDDKPDW